MTLRMDTAPAVKREFARAATVIVRLRPSPALAGVNGKRALDAICVAENFWARTLSPPAGVNIAIHDGAAVSSGPDAFAAKAGMIIGERANEAVASITAAKVAYFPFCARFTFIASFRAILFRPNFHTPHFGDSKGA
jgi:hypothetical protein